MRKVMTLALLVLLALPGALAPTARAEDPAPAGAGGKVYTVATSHLDTQWRWTIQTTISEYLRATLDDNFALLEKYPDYVFSFEGAFRYQLFQEYYPQEFARLRTYVDQGRWRICGSWLDAVDVNMPSPESLFRHALYGNGWFDREFGKRSVDVFLPDCFGFGYALPSIMAHSGLSGFSTQKLTWGSAYGTPFDIGRWRGVDGSEVIAAIKPGDYVGELKGDLTRDPELQASVDRTVAAGGPAVAFKYYGTGDTGGSPTEASVQTLQSSVGGDGPLTIYPAGADQIFLADGGDLVINSFTLKLGNVAFGGPDNDNIESLKGIDVLFGGPEDDALSADEGYNVTFPSSNFEMAFGDLLFGGREGLR
jgi:alpha-mannosidase